MVEPPLVRKTIYFPSTDFTTTGFVAVVLFPIGMILRFFLSIGWEYSGEGMTFTLSFILSLTLSFILYLTLIILLGGLIILHSLLITFLGRGATGICATGGESGIEVGTISLEVDNFGDTMGGEGDDVRFIRDGYRI